MSDVRLAFFIPGIVYMADAVGTQTETLVIRGLSVGVPIRRVFRMETLTGMLVGLVLAAITLPTVWLILDPPGSQSRSASPHCRLRRGHHRRDVAAVADVEGRTGPRVREWPAGHRRCRTCCPW